MVKKFLIIIIFFPSLAVISAEHKVPFAIGEWRPYTGENLENYGMASEIITAACDAVDLVPEYSFYPWRRAELYVEQGKSFATFPFADVPERKENFYFSNVIVSSSISVLKYKKNKKTLNFIFKQVKDFSGYNIGTTIGSLRITAPLKNDKINYEETDNFDLSLLKLQAGRIDFIIDNEVVMIDSIRRIFPENTDDFEILDRDFVSAVNYKIMVSKKYPGSINLLKQFNSGLEIIRKNGTLRQIYRKYGIDH
ncbi:MAG: transporter substrate-binding domain-containing protein [Spirochaetes bacterium]|nr:transporter substrate-binding domain-containing protein [Spirochaetota bacterium]